VAGERSRQFHEPRRDPDSHPGALNPACFFIAPGGELRVGHRPAESCPWEVFRGHLLDHPQTRLRKTFESWDVFAGPPDSPTGGLILSVKLDPAERQIHVTRNILAHVWEWVVYSKPPFGGPSQVLKYLARYTHRVALSNNRLLRLKVGQVTFSWKNYTAGGTRQRMTLSAVEFLRRFLLHVLPKGFVRIRRCGWWTNRHGQRQLDRCRDLLRVAPAAVEPAREADQPIPAAVPEAAPRCSHRARELGAGGANPSSHALGTGPPPAVVGGHLMSAARWIPRSLPCRASSSATARLVLCADHALRAFPSTCSLQTAHRGAGRHHPDSPRDLPPHRAAD
jgi:Putative transposase